MSSVRELFHCVSRNSPMNNDQSWLFSVSMSTDVGGDNLHEMSNPCFLGKIRKILPITADAPPYKNTISNYLSTWRKYNVASTSMQRHDVASTLRWRYIHVMRRWGDVIFMAHDVNITSPQRRCNLMTLHRRWVDVIFTSWHASTLRRRYIYVMCVPWRKYNVASTSMQRHDVASTLWRRYMYVMCLPGI